MIRLVLKGSVLLLIILALALEAPGAANLHPRLILNSARIAALKTGLHTTHRELWKSSLQTADQLAQLSIPALEDARNRYRYIGDSLPALGLAYWMTGERRYVIAAERWLAALIAVPAWRGSANLGRSAWVVGSALLYDWLYQELPEEIRVRARKRLVDEGEILLRETSYWRLLSNHCLIETAALGMTGLALHGEVDEAATFLQIARERSDLIIEHAPQDGSWGEGIQYWQYGLGYFLRYLEASRTAADRNYFPKYSWLEKTGFFPIHFSVPGRPQETLNFSDSGHNDYMAAFLMYLAASVYRNGYYQDYGNKIASLHPHKLSWMDFIAYDPDVAPVSIAKLPTFKHFNDNGFIVARSSWEPGATLVGFRCGPAPGHRNQSHPLRLERRGFGPGHGHPDINSFAFFAYGQWLAIDPGYVRRKWTREHNTLLVNGYGQAGEGGEWLDYMAFESRHPAPAILYAESEKDYDYWIGDAGNIYVDEAGLKHFRRHVLFLKPDILVVMDDVEGRDASRFEWLLHAQDGITRTASDQFEIVQNRVRLWIRPFLPHNYEARISEHQIQAVSGSGKIAVLDLAAELSGRSRFLVVLCALPGPDASVPKAVLQGEWLTIKHKSRSWTVQVSALMDSRPASAPLLKVRKR